MVTYLGYFKVGLRYIYCYFTGHPRGYFKDGLWNWIHQHISTNLHSYLLNPYWVKPTSKSQQGWRTRQVSATAQIRQYKSSLLSPKSLLGEADFKVPIRVKNSSSICYCFRDHPLEGSSKMVREDSLTVTYLHGSSKTTFRVKPHSHLPWVLQSWSPIYLNKDENSSYLSV